MKKRAMLLNKSKKSPYIKLWAEVLKQAIEDKNRGDKSQKYWARQWFKSDDSGLPSFIAVCEILDLNHELVRARLKEPILFTDKTIKRICIYCKKKKIEKYMAFVPLDGGYICKRCNKKLMGSEKTKKGMQKPRKRIRLLYGRRKVL